MLPREMKVTYPDLATGPTAAFVKRNYHHFNAGEMKNATESAIRLLQRKGSLFLAMAGALSTARIGIPLAKMIRAGYISGISTTGANIEEDVFNLVARDDYIPLPNYRELTRQDEQQLMDAHLNRVTDTAIPEESAMGPIEQRIIALWKRADTLGQRGFPHEYLYRLLQSGKLKANYQIDPDESWMLAAAEKNLMLVVPGWEDSTLGNVFSALTHPDAREVDPDIMRPGFEYTWVLGDWFMETMKKGPMGFLQLGGGIAGDYSICVVPYLQQDRKLKNIKFWEWFCQITEARQKSGGYSGAPGKEKITWGKLTPKSEIFEIDGDASMIAPLIFDQMLGI